MIPAPEAPSRLTPVKLISVIRFHLGELSARNGHHEFESLCRHLARARIYRNIIPATGPVGAGGDQGRDFETYSAGYEVGLFDRNVSDGKAVFCCSLEKRIEKKARADVAAATKGGEVREIFCFFGQNLPVAKRHKLQKWAAETHRVSLEIFDGTAIAEMLSDRDVFWIAQEFLHIPAEIVPAAIDEGGWYGALLGRWSSREPLTVSAADFSEIKFGLRRATFHEEARPNLLLWIQLMERFLEPPAPRHLQRSAIYEIAVAHLRGKGEMTSQADRLRDYFADLGDWLAVADLKDAAVLQAYAFGGLLLKHLDMDPGELLTWRANLLSLLDREIEAATGPGRRSGLLDTRGYLKLLPDATEAEPPLDQAFDDWDRMLVDAEETPLFPIAEFASHLAKMTGGLGHHPRFEKFAERVDELLAKRQGPVVAAESTFERALEFYKADDLLHAVRDLHRIQVRWFTGDSMVRFQQASFMLANSYLELGAAYAAKYVALAAAFLARSSDDLEVASTAPKMLFLAADADDGAGNSVSYLHLLLVAMLAHFEQDPDPLDQNKHPEIDKQLGQAAALRGFAAKSGPSQLAAVDRALSIWLAPFRESVVRASLDPDGFWTKGTWDEAWSTMEQSFLDRPFGDLGGSRTIGWRALGIHWTIAFNNDVRTVAVAEEFAASLQMALVALAGHDFCLLPMRVHLNVSLAKRPRITVDESKTSEGVMTLDLAIRREARGKDLPRWSAETLAPIAHMLQLLSVLRADRLEALMKETFRDLAGRIHVALPYRELYREWVDDATFDEDGRRASLPLLADHEFKNRGHPLLSARIGPGPGYSRAEALERIEIRYAKGAASSGFTARRLMAHPERRKLLMAWRAEGLKDWEILSIIANAAINLRHPLTEDVASKAEAMEKLRSALEFVETSDAAIEPDLIPDGMLLGNRRAFQVAYLRSWNLDVHYSKVDEKAVETFLIERYGLRSDDVDHSDVFGWDTTGEAAS